MNWSEVADRLTTNAWKQGELTEEEYRDMQIGTAEERLNRMVESLKEKKQTQLIKGAEFIESITPDDPRYNKAFDKYDCISHQLDYRPEPIRKDDLIPTYWSVYTAMCECADNYGRKMKREELFQIYSMLTARQITWGMWEYDNALSNPDLHIKFS